jgi:hypothetical protein
MESKIPRRIFLKAGLSGMAMLALPWGCYDPLPGSGESPDVMRMAAEIAGPGRFLTSEQYATLQALTNVIIPEDDDPGAKTANVTDYIDYLLGAFTVNPPRIYAAGPFSGRHGGDNGFSTYLPLSRVKEIAWRNYIEGSKGIPEREFNGPVIGLQEIYTKGLAKLNSQCLKLWGLTFKDLTPQQQETALQGAEKAFIDQVFRNTVEGMYAAPEYGGNQDLVGWKYIDYEGDRQPIGYTREELEGPYDGTLSPDELEIAKQFFQEIVAKYKDALL